MLEELHEIKEITGANTEQEMRYYYNLHGMDKLANNIPFFRRVMISYHLKLPVSLENFSKEIRDNKELVLMAIKKNDENYQYASERLKNDKSIFLQQLKYHQSLHRSDQRIIDKDFLIEVISKLEPVDEFKRLKFSDIHQIKKVLSQGKTVLTYASEELKNDKDFVIATIKHNLKCFRDASCNLKNEKNL